MLPKLMFLLWMLEWSVSSQNGMGDNETCYALSWESTLSFDFNRQLIHIISTYDKVTTYFLLTMRLMKRQIRGCGKANVHDTVHAKRHYNLFASFAFLWLEFCYTDQIHVRSHRSLPRAPCGNAFPRDGLLPASNPNQMNHLTYRATAIRLGTNCMRDLVVCIHLKHGFGINRFVRGKSNHNSNSNYRETKVKRYDRLVP